MQFNNDLCRIQYEKLLFPNSPTLCFSGQNQATIRGVACHVTSSEIDNFEYVYRQGYSRLDKTRVEAIRRILAGLPLETAAVIAPNGAPTVTIRNTSCALILISTLIISLFNKYNLKVCVN